MATSPADVRMSDLPEFSLRCSKPSAAPCAPMLLSLVPARNTPECLSIVFNVVQKERLRVDSVRAGIAGNEEVLIPGSCISPWHRFRIPYAVIH